MTAWHSININIVLSLVSEGHGVPWVLDDRGTALLGLGRYAGAISNFNSAIAMEPNDAYALFNRAITILNLDLYSQPLQLVDSLHEMKQPLQRQITFKHMDAALQERFGY